MLALLVSGDGALLGYVINMVSVSTSLKSVGFYSYVVFTGSMWFMPILSMFSASRWSLSSGDAFFKIGDKGWSEYFGGEGGFDSLMKGSVYLQLSQENMIMIYMKGFFIWVVVMFFIFI